MCWNKGRRLCWKIAKLFYFCLLKKLVRPETFGPYYAQSLRHKCEKLIICKVYPCRQHGKSLNPYYSKIVGLSVLPFFIPYEFFNFSHLYLTDYIRPQREQFYSTKISVLRICLYFILQYFMYLTTFIYITILSRPTIYVHVIVTRNRWSINVETCRKKLYIILYNNLTHITN